MIIVANKNWISCLFVCLAAAAALTVSFHCAVSQVAVVVAAVTRTTGCLSRNDSMPN